MAKDSVDKILSAENLAESTEAEAKVKASEMVSSAKKQASDIVAAAANKAEKEAIEIISAAKAEADKILKEAKDATSDGFKLSQKAYEKKEEALEAVIKSLI